MTSPVAPQDGAFMRRALELARRGWGQTAPNPMVGAVVVQGGEIVGEGWHEVFGGPHAEVNALAAAGEQARGADLYVTLEPCTHHGKTPPCVDALIAAGVRRVVIANADPNPAAKGGAARLRAARIAVDEGVESDAAEDLNEPFFFQFREADRPFITLKLALSADGALAMADRRQRWLTGEPARQHVHSLRATADAIAVGIGTAIADDPSLTVRHGPPPRVPPIRVVFDRKARLPPGSKLVSTAKEVPTWVLSETPSGPRAAALAKAGVAVRAAPSLRDQLALLRHEGVRHLFVEGGAELANSLLADDLVDRLIIFRAPVLLGAGALPGPGAAVPPADGSLTERWQVVERQSFGDDQMTRYRAVR
jgi:diaminohydroxyphosphoribosylaminopyrimidine deaminase/5-amino-6-(5-phosphoribosylamino)uracil reductase